MTDYRVSFERVGRNHDVEPMRFEDVTEADELAALIHQRVRGLLGSRFYEVVVELDDGVGEIIVGGFRPAGRFTITET